MPNKILILHNEGNSFNNPSLKAVIDVLLEKGYECHIRYVISHSPMPATNGIRPLIHSRLLHTIKRIAYDIICSQWMAHCIVSIENLLLYSYYDLIIAIDRYGLIEAAILNKINNTPFIFISFEIMFEEETSFRFKQLEKTVGQKCCFWIAQDEIRSGHLITENLLDQTKKFILPLASSGLGLTSSLSLRDRLGIPKEKKVAILIGSLCKWSMIEEIVTSTAEWPEDWTLIVHERYGRTETRLHQLGLKPFIASGRVHFSNHASESVDEMGWILSGISAGIAFYLPTYDSRFTGKNLLYLGRAAGKISTYLRYGIPVITNEIGLYAEDIRQNGMGLVVEHPSYISSALPKINAEMSERARQYFSDFLDFNLRKDALVKKLENCIALRKN